MAHQLHCTAIEPSKRSHTPPSRCIGWFNLRRLYQHCGDIPPVELATAYYAQHRDQPPAEFSHRKVSGLTGAVHGDVQEMT
jgi:hypothetical protein